MGPSAERAFRATDENCSLVLPQDSGSVWWWTCAGGRASGLLAAALSAVEPGPIDEADRYDNRYIRLRCDATAGGARRALSRARELLREDLASIQRSVNDEALRQLKFADLLPPALAALMLGQRAGDPGGAAIRTRR